MFYSHAYSNEQGEKAGSKALLTHLNEVGNLSRQNILETPVTNKNVLGQVAFCIGACHDFGKYTSYFQSYLLANTKKGRLYEHGLVSALYAAYYIESVYEDFSLPYNKYLPLIAYIVVLHHHGNLGSTADHLVTKTDLVSPNYKQVPSRIRERLLIVKQQIEDLKKNVKSITEDYSKLLKEPAIEDFLNNWEDTFLLLDKLMYDLEEQNKDFRLKLSFTCYLIYSALIDADKHEAAAVGVTKRFTIPADLVDRYMKANFSEYTDPMAKMRWNIYRNVTSAIQDISLDQHIFTFTAPTGSGKTLSSFSAAVKLRARIEEEKHYTPRIIYALPFTSIIDQNYLVLFNVLSQLGNFGDNINNYIIKHHYLAEVSYKAEGVEAPLDKALMRTESWESEVIVTTFIQLFYSIIAYKNNFLKKFHNIAGSIILLDEVQNIDIEYWPLIRTALMLLCEITGCYIILLTATKPLIFEEDETYELLHNNSKYFSKLNRVKIIPKLKEVTTQEFCNYFKEQHNPNLNYLIVMNTIRTSIEVFEELSSISDVHLFYLSTNILPLERAHRIERIQQAISAKEKVIVVSTQVVEAGVDFDMDIIFRDMGPIDSIVQVAGRCNRHYQDEKKLGSVYIYHLVDDKQDYASMVYGKIHCIHAKNLLKEKEYISENEFYDLIEDFFEGVSKAKNKDKSRKLIDHLARLEFDKLRDFELIVDNPDYVDVFVEIDSKSQALFQAYIRDVINEKDRVKRKHRWLEIKGPFNKHIISVPNKLVRGLDATFEDIGLYRLPLEGLDLYYDEQTGFRRTDSKTFIF